MDEFEESENQIEDVFPKAGESLVEFLYRCQADDSKVMLYPRCSIVFDKKATKKFEKAKKVKEKENQKKVMPHYYFNKRRVPQRKEQTSGPQKAWSNTYKPTTNAPQGKWIKPIGREHDKKLKWRNFEIGRGSSMTYK